MSSVFRVCLQNTVSSGVVSGRIHSIRPSLVQRCRKPHIASFVSRNRDHCDDYYQSADEDSRLKLFVTMSKARLTFRVAQRRHEVADAETLFSLLWFRSIYPPEVDNSPSTAPKLGSRQMDSKSYTSESAPRHERPAVIGGLIKKMGAQNAVRYQGSSRRCCMVMES
jgi:hypothetical protein